MNYAIFRSEPIYTLNDLAQIGSHNKREKKSYNSNPDINKEKTKDNIDLVPLADKYVKGFYNITKEYRKEHEERMKTEREDRKKTFNQMLNKSKNVVADELLFTATHEFFKEMTKEEIIDWANTCMDFVYEDLGYKKEQILHATIHMDEKTPHLHCVVVPLIRKMDNRTHTERYTISKKQYIRDKAHLSELQDKYHKRLTDKGYDLERGIKHSDTAHLKIHDYKKITKKINNELDKKTEKLNSLITEMDEKMKSSKDMLFDKEYVKVKKDTFDTMKKVVYHVKRVIEVQPRIENTFQEINNYAQSYHYLENENENIKKEITYLKNKNLKLQAENKNLKEFIKRIFLNLKRIFKNILHIGNENAKNFVSEETKSLYIQKEFNNDDIIYIANNTTKERELYQFANIPTYNKEKMKDIEKEKSDYDISL